MTTKDTIDTYFTQLSQQKAWSSLLADDLVFTSYTASGQRVTGKAAYLETTSRFFAMITGVEVRRLMIDGAQACALTRYQLRTPAGASFSSDVAEVFDVRDGRIAALDIYFDSAPFAPLAPPAPTAQ